MSCKNPRTPATGKMVYRVGGKIKTWEMGCCYDETLDDWRNTLARIRPGAELIEVRIVADWWVHRDSASYPDKTITA